jgi:hypothetical protein
MMAKAQPSDFERAVRLAVSRAVARKDVPDDVVRSVAEKLEGIHSHTPIRWVDICPYGICIEHIVEADRWRDALTQIFDAGEPIRAVRLFPWGILVDDLMQIHVEQEFEELAPYIEGVGGERFHGVARMI